MNIHEATRILFNKDSINNENLKIKLQALSYLYNKKKINTLVPILPILLNLKGKPYSLTDHFPMEPLFSLFIPRSIVFKSARQISKSTTLAGRACLISCFIKDFASLYMCPRHEQTRRFSNNYVKPFLTTSVLGRLFLNTNMEQSVFQRSFTNRSVQYFSFAFLDPDRVRGISAESVSYDEVQDIDVDFIPIINECLSASHYDLRQYSGTPKTYDNTLEHLWQMSSMAEWVTPCYGCKKDNVATVSEDLLDMIQPKGISCAKCGRAIDPRNGHWEHQNPKLRSEFPGYHVPQPILPLHYMPNPLTGDMRKWHQLVDAKNTMRKATFFNEKLGESCDTRVNLITKSDLISCSSLKHKNIIKEAIKAAGKYNHITMGVDWGGGGELGMSYTAIAIIGHHPIGTTDVLFMERLTNTIDPISEIKLIGQYFHACKCFLLAHDYGGAGAVKETLLIQAGFTLDRLFPSYYVQATCKDMVTYNPPSSKTLRWYYSVDKARSLALMCELIKAKQFRFPAFESWENLSGDFLSLVENKQESKRGSDIFLITKKAGKTDDVAQAVNIGSIAYWHASQNYPNLAKRVGIRITKDQYEEETV